MKTINNSIKPSSHPSHYLIHRYWGRKAHNVVNAYILHFTNCDETVMDPFMGSGVTVIESLKLQRKAIGVDLNPIACFITQSTIEKVNLENLVKDYENIFEGIDNLNFYSTFCPICKKESVGENFIWEGDVLRRVRGYCEEHGKFIKNAEDIDIEKMEYCKQLFHQELQKGRINFPTQEILRYVKRSGINRIYELFTERALLLLTSLKNKIQKLDDVTNKNMLKLCFSSILADVSKMIPGDLETGNSKSGWVISKLYVPKIHSEKNAIFSFKQKFSKLLKAKKETNILLGSNNYQILNKSSENLPEIPSSSVDYIFTDPPYGENIPYFGVSMLWNSWLGFEVDYENEIICDSYRDKTIKKYKEDMAKVFREMFRVLKPERYLSFTFHNRNLEIWRAVIESCRESGFRLKNIVYQPQAVGSGTQGLNRKNTLKDDFIYNFIKPTQKIQSIQNYKKGANHFIMNLLKKRISKNGGFTTARVYEFIIPIIVRENAYLDEEGKAIDLNRLLKENFKYKEFKLDKNRSEYRWVCV